MADGNRTVKIEILGDAGSATKALQDTATSAEATGKAIEKALPTGANNPLVKFASESETQGSRLKGIFDTALGVFGGGLISKGIGGLVGLAKESAIGMNASLETTTLQFTTLMGNADNAKQHVSDLFTFAKDTPFETQPVIDASKALRTFGGDALDTKGNLTLIGDAAAATGSPIQELGFWTGRLYSDLKGGKPFGEAASRMQELAVLTPQARQEMEKMQASGASADQIFAVFQKNLGNFSGAMKTQAGTWQGQISTFSDTLHILAAQGMAPFFELAKTGLGKLNDILSSPAVQTGITNFAARFASGIQVVAAFVGGTLIPAVVKLVGALQGPLTTAFVVVRDTIITFVQALSGNWTDAPGIVGVTARVGDLGLIIRNQVIPAVKALAEWFMTTALPAIVDFATSAKNTFTTIATWIQANVFPLIQQAFQWFMSTGLPALQAFAKQAIATFQQVASWVQNDLIPALRQFAEWFQTVAVPAIQAFAAKVTQFMQQQIIPAIRAVIDFLLVTVWPQLSKIINDAITLFGNLATWTKTHWDTIQAVISPIVASIQTVISVAWNTISGVTQGVWTTISGTIQGALKVIDGIIKTFTALFTGDWSGAWKGIEDIFSGAWLIIKSEVSGALKIIQTALSSAWQLISGEMGNAWDTMKNLLDGILGKIKDAITAPIDGAKTKLGELWGDISTKAGDTWDALHKKFDDAKEGLKNVLLWPFEQMRDAIGGIMSSVESNAKTPINDVIGGLNKVGGAVAGALRFVGEKLNIGSLKGINFADLPRFAKGVTGFGGGMAVVGEEGPEIVNLPRGSDVIPNGKTRAILSRIAEGNRQGLGGGPFDFASGIIDSAKDAVGKVMDTVKSWTDKGADWVVSQALHLPSLNLPGSFGEMTGGLMSTVKDNFVDFVKGLLSSMKGLIPKIVDDGSGGFTGGGPILEMAKQVRGTFGLCEKFVGDVMQRLGMRYARAGSAEEHAHMQHLNPGYGPAGAIQFFPDSTGFGHVGFSLGDGSRIYSTVNTPYGTGIMHDGATPYGWTVNPAAKGAYVNKPTLLLSGEGGDPEGEVTSPVSMLRKVIQEEMRSGSLKAPHITQHITGLQSGDVERETRKALRRMALEIKAA
jgi:phage-related protein